jgi:hypothetical protein
MGFHLFTFSKPNTEFNSDLAPMRLNHEKGAPRQEISKWSTVCRTFSRRGCSVVRSASLAEEGTWDKRRSPLLHNVPTRSNKVSSRTSQTALVCVCVCVYICMCMYTYTYSVVAEPKLLLDIIVSQ